MEPEYTILDMVQMPWESTTQVPSIKRRVRRIGKHHVKLPKEEYIRQII